MPSLEYIIRPFQSPLSQGGVIIASSQHGTIERATLTWGAKSAVPPVKPTGVQFAGCCQETSDEDSRDTETHRIYDASEPENWIDVQRTTQLRLNKNTKDDCAGDWDQFSGVGLEITDALDQFSADIHSGTAAPVGDSGACKVAMNLNNNTM